MQEQIIKFTKRDATVITGGTSQTSKMPCKSWSIPVFMCQRGSKLMQVEGSVCSDCYADRGMYHMYRDNIEPAQVARWDALTTAMETPDGLRLWAMAIARIIGDDDEFRWLDAGDLQSADMLSAIALVATLTPRTKHWLPTREYEFVAEYLQKSMPIPKNLVIRLSALMVDQPMKIPSALRDHPQVVASEVHTTDTVREGVFPCGAYTRGGKCGPCRACWNPEVKVVSYPKH